MKHLMYFLILFLQSNVNCLIDEEYILDESSLISDENDEIIKTPDKLMQEIMDKVDNISEASIDLEEKLKLIKEISAALLKLASTFGALLFTSLTLISKPDSPEFKALKKLNDMLVQFDRLNERIFYSFDVEEMDAEVRYFDNFITLQLNVLSREVIYFTDPTKVKGNESIAYLLTYCTGTNGIEKMSEYIKEKITFGCSLDNTNVYIKITNIFNNLEERFNIIKWNKHEKYLKEKILNSIYTIPAYKSIQILEEIERILFDFTTFESAINQIRSMTRHKKLINHSRCLTDAVINGNYYNRINVSFFEALVQIELSRLLMAANLCGKFMFPTDITKLDNFLINVGDNVVRTSQFLVNYIPTKLNMSGPVEKLVTSNIIRKFPAVGDISYLQYNDLANLIYENLKHIGNKRIEKQIIVYASENAIKQVEGISECPEYWCDQVFNQRGVNIVIARFNKNDVYHGYSLMLRVNQQLKPEILKMLKVKYYIELKKLLEEFKSNNISLVDNQIIRTATIVRHKTSWSEKCSFLLSTTKAYRRSTNELPFIDSFNFRNEPHKGLFDDFTCFVFYFAI